MQKEQRLYELMNMDIFTCLINGLLKVYGDLLVSIMLYGSVAQGTQQEESHIDIAVFIKRGSTKEMKDNMCDLIVDLELEYNEVEN